MACDVTGVARSRWLNVLWQMMLIIQVVHEHLVSVVRYLRRSRHVVELIRVKVRQAQALVA